MSVESPAGPQVLRGDDLQSTRDQVVSTDEAAWSSAEGPFRVVVDLCTRLSRTIDFESGMLSAMTVLHRFLHARDLWLELGPANARRTLRVGDTPESETSDKTGDHAGIATVAMTTALIAAGENVGTLGCRVQREPTGETRAVLHACCGVMAATIAQATRTRELEHEVIARVREVAEQRRFIERVVDSFPAGLYVVDRTYRIQAWNRKRETGMQGVSRDEAIGRTIFEVLNRQPAALLKREFDEVFATGRLQQFEMESSATGDVRTFRISKIPMRLDDDRVTHVITIGEDITEWKAAIDRTAQSEKLAAIGQLAAGVMHEINNPLATIAACAESLALLPALAEPSDVSPNAKTSSPGQLLGIIDLEVQRCKKIVNGLLDFSRPKPATREPLQLNTVVQHAVFLLRHHPRYKQVKVETDLEQSHPLTVRGDADQLVQVLLALSFNAFDATPSGKRVTLRTRVDSDTEGEPIGIVEVADEGPGVPRAHYSKVFEPFFTTKAQGQGTGLGLAISYGIVSDHGGVLELVHAEGPGATFRVSLPLAGAL